MTPWLISTVYADEVVVGQLETMVDAASKLGQAGVVAVMVFFLIAMGWAIKSLFKAHQENTQAVIEALTKNTAAMETHSRTLEANEKASEANRRSIEELKNLFDAAIMRRKV